MNTEKEIARFLNEICKNLGICDPLYISGDLVSREHYEVNSFIREIFILEGLDPDLQIKLFRKAKIMFTTQFGSEFYKL